MARKPVLAAAPVLPATSIDFDALHDAIAAGKSEADAVAASVAAQPAETPTEAPSEPDAPAGDDDQTKGD